MAFAPDLAVKNIGYNPESFELLASVEAIHFWFLGRNSILRDCLSRYFSGAMNILEIGCGTGFVLSNVRLVFPDARLSGSDIFTEGLGFAKQRVPDATLFQMDAMHIPFRNEFDVIGAFDVLEHIDDDQAALAQIYQACQPGGGVILTVPQHPWLWSGTDDYAHHKRRYTRSELVEKTERAGFKVEYVSAFISLLLPAMLLSRLMQRSSHAGEQIDTGLHIGKISNTLFAAVMKVERWMMARGWRFSLGGSLLLVARKGVA
jgi:SAM-dependent methyltransferase